MFKFKKNDVAILFVKYQRTDSVLFLSVFGFKVFKRVGNVKSLFGFVWGCNAS